MHVCNNIRVYSTGEFAGLKKAVFDHFCDILVIYEQGSKWTKAGGAEKSSRANIDIKCPLYELHLHVIILKFVIICN